MKYIVLLVVLFFSTASYAESDANNNGQCDEVAIRRLCNNSPFSEFYVVNTPDIINLKLCKDESTTYKIKDDEVMTKHNMDLYCKGIYE